MILVIEESTKKACSSKKIGLDVDYQTYDASGHMRQDSSMALESTGNAGYPKEGLDIDDQSYQPATGGH